MPIALRRRMHWRALSALLFIGCTAEVTTIHPPATSPAHRSTTCDDPEPVLQPDGTASGFVACSDGFIHRAEVVRCNEPQLPGECGGDIEGECTTDADCAHVAYGSCVRGYPWDGCHCQRGCAVDGDCGPGQVCACAGVVDERSRCIDVIDCSSDGGCEGTLCGLYRRRDPCGVWSARLGCVASEAGCRVDADCRQPGDECGASFGEIPACMLAEDGWACQPWGESCGPCG